MSSAVEAWRRRVESHHAQSLKVMDESAQRGDFWRTLAHGFRADPHRTDDEALNAILDLVPEDATVLDVGGGAGRYALPLAFKCRSVTVVDPSESMLKQLREARSEVGISNVAGLYSDWESASVEPADVVLCSHVVYGIADIRPFIQKLAAQAKRRVILVSFVDSPQSGVAALWEPVYGEKRINLPALPELINVLWEMEIYPDIQMLSSARPPRFETIEAATEELTLRLFIGSDTAAKQKLEAVVLDYLESTADGYRIKRARPVRQGVITWAVRP